MILIAALLCWIPIMLIAFLLIPLYNNYRIDALRQKLFQLRGELFDWANKGEISFDNDAYITLRETINTYIRFAHFFNLTRFILFSMVLNNKGDIHKTFQEKLKGIQNREQKKVIITYYRKLTNCIMNHIISSPVVFSIMVASTPLIITILLLGKRQVKKPIKEIKKPIAKLSGRLSDQVWSMDEEWSNAYTKS
jgi:hypothetical protein